MNIIGMLPSEIERLKVAEPTPELTDELLQSIASLVNSDGGHDETVFLAARNLSKAGLPRFVDPQALAEVVENAASTATQQFLKGLPAEYAGQVAIELLAFQNAMEPEEDVQTMLNYGVVEVPIVPSALRVGRVWTTRPRGVVSRRIRNQKTIADAMRAAPPHLATYVVFADGNITDAETAEFSDDNPKPDATQTWRVSNPDS